MWIVKDSSPFLDSTVLAVYSETLAIFLPSRWPMGQRYGQRRQMQIHSEMEVSQTPASHPENGRLYKSANSACCLNEVDLDFNHVQPKFSRDICFPTVL